MHARLDKLSVESIGKLGLPQPDIAIPKVRCCILLLASNELNTPQLCLLLAIMHACGIKRGRYLRTLGDNMKYTRRLCQFFGLQEIRRRFSRCPCCGIRKASDWSLTIAVSQCVNF